ncbi:hypothetical protein AB4Z48_30395 [Cupriavidus sp. 2TAF22]|uniref:hypothetical protein n=1 Tax=unclassified Cupriavidus TaxID=2640874 RepID=UPI003F91F32B
MADPIESEEARQLDVEVARIVSRGPSGTFAIAGVATAIVIAIYFGFYLFVYLPRGVVQ